MEQLPHHTLRPYSDFQMYTQVRSNNTVKACLWGMSVMIRYTGKLRRRSASLGYYHVTGEKTKFITPEAFDKKYQLLKSTSNEPTQKTQVK